MFRSIQAVSIVAAVAFLFAGCDNLNGPELNSSDTADAGVSSSATTVPGHTDRYDSDDNGFPDEGVTVNGHYTSLYAYDANGDWYLDYGDGRPGNPGGTVGSVDELEQATLTTCEYVINYRGSFENDPSLDNGRIDNHINCQGYDDSGKYHVTWVHETHPRYTGEKPPAFDGTWEESIQIISGSGNVFETGRYEVRPETHAGN